MKTGMSTTNTIISRVLLAGVIASLVLILIGSIMLMIHQSSAQQLGPNGLIDGIVEMQPNSIINLGIIVLLLTPAARVIAAGISFAIEHDYRYVAISAAVLGVMTTAALVGLK
jgi:uncharacterized membrane protein